MDLLKDVFSFPVEKMVAFSDYVKSQMVDGLSGKESDNPSTIWLFTSSEKAT